MNDSISIDRYHEGICEFPGGKKSAEAEQLAAALARLIVERQVEEKKAA